MKLLGNFCLMAILTSVSEAKLASCKTRVSRTFKNEYCTKFGTDKFTKMDV